MIAIGVLLFLVSVYGITLQYSVFILYFGIILTIVGVSILLWVSRPWNFSAPHSCVIGITAGAIALHSYEFFFKGDGDPSIFYGQ